MSKIKYMKIQWQYGMIEKAKTDIFGENRERR